MKKFTKWLIVIAFVAFFGAKSAINKLFDNRPIKFESFSSDDSDLFYQEIKEMFPICTAAEYARDVIERSGAKCEIDMVGAQNVYIPKEDIDRFGIKYRLSCDYTSFSFSGDLFHILLTYV